jgi:hypothetical protein
MPCQHLNGHTHNNYFSSSFHGTAQLPVENAGLGREATTASSSWVRDRCLAMACGILLTAIKGSSQWHRYFV